MNRQARFFEVMPCSERDYAPYGVAYFPHQENLFLLPTEFVRVDDWPGYSLILKDGDFNPALANNQAVRLFSKEIMNFLNSHKTECDSLQWLPVVVTQGDEKRDYYVLNFPLDIHPLDVKATKWIPGSEPPYPRVPVLREELIGKHEVFAIRNGGYFFVVSLELRRLLGRAFPKAFSYRPLDVSGPA